MKITLQDIANSTGYSVSTVSRVLSGSEKISEKAKMEIIDTAQRLKYPLSRVRPADRAKTYLNIALIADFHEGEFYASYFYGFVQAAKDFNIRLSLLSLINPKEEMRDYIGHLSDQYYDGAVLFIPAFLKEDYEALLSEVPENFPIISNSLIESPVFTTITFDGYSGGHIAADHFFNRNYFEVGIVKGPFFKSESRFRYNGFRDYIGAHPEMKLLFEFNGDFNYNSGVEAFEAFRKLDRKPRAVFVSNDLMCHGFIEAAKHHGYDIPKDVAVLGYDDLPMCQHSHPLISSVKTDFHHLGTASLKAIYDRIHNPKNNQGLLSFVPVNLSAREST